MSPFRVECLYSSIFYPLSSIFYLLLYLPFITFYKKLLAFSFGKSDKQRNKNERKMVLLHNVKALALVGFYYL
jgi:hypothetical protein